MPRPTSSDFWVAVFILPKDKAPKMMGSIIQKPIIMPMMIKTLAAVFISFSFKIY